MTVPQPADYEFDKGDVHEDMGGDYWRVSARLYNFDARKVEYYNSPNGPVDVTREWHRREYELTCLDPETMGADPRRVNEHDLVSHFNNEATVEEAREYYENQEAEA